MAASCVRVLHPRRAHARFLQSWSRGSSTMSHVIPLRLFQTLKSSRWNCNVCGLCRKMTVLNYVRLLGGCPRKGEAYGQRGRAHDVAGQTTRACTRHCRAHDAAGLHAARPRRVPGSVVCTPALSARPRRAPGRVVRTLPLSWDTHPKVARNLTRSFFDIAHKRCNSNDSISMFEIIARELRATLLRNHGTTTARIWRVHDADARRGRTTRPHRAPGSVVYTLPFLGHSPKSRT